MVVVAEEEFLLHRYCRDTNSPYSPPPSVGTLTRPTHCTRLWSGREEREEHAGVVV